ncbi:hypothetical protein E4U53_004381 [Claviceps sorghi]|nr:hypothetical protein E4U53_004381 [Claviceps sorghi]
MWCRAKPLASSTGCFARRSTTRCLATASPVRSTSKSHKVVVVGAGTAGLSISHQLLRSGRFNTQDIAVVEPSTWHHYQPGWTLVGGGLKDKEDLCRKTDELIDARLGLYKASVAAVAPGKSWVTLADGAKLNYEHLVVAPGLRLDFGAVDGLADALSDADSAVSTIYSYDTCDKAFRTVQNLSSGTAIFTQPAGVIKCAGAPQKMLWLALDYWKRAGLYTPGKPGASAVNISFATGLPAMFAVPKYAAKLEELRRERGVEGLFQHDLVAIRGDKATFARPNGEQVTRHFDLLHVTPKMGPPAFIRESAIGNDAGYVDVDDHTLRHRTYPNIWSAGDASSLPTSKTAAAVTSEAPVLVRNLLRALDGLAPDASYDGYTSCPLLTEYGKVLLAEFKYGGEPKETFDDWLGVDQIEPRRAFYHLKKDFFPWVYYTSLVRGTWGGPRVLDSTVSVGVVIGILVTRQTALLVELLVLQNENRPQDDRQHGHQDHKGSAKAVSPHVVGPLAQRIGPCPQQRSTLPDQVEHNDAGSTPLVAPLVVEYPGQNVGNGGEDAHGRQEHARIPDGGCSPKGEHQIPCRAHEGQANDEQPALARTVREKRRDDGDDKCYEIRRGG